MLPAPRSGFKVLGGGKIRFQWGKNFVFIIYLKEIFLGPKKFWEALHTPLWLRAWALRQDFQNECSRSASNAAMETSIHEATVDWYFSPAHNVSFKGNTHHVVSTRAVEQELIFPGPDPGIQIFWLRHDLVHWKQKRLRFIFTIGLLHKLCLLNENPNSRLRLHSPGFNGSFLLDGSLSWRRFCVTQ